MPKILIADDSIAVRKVAERLLTEAGMGSKGIVASTAAMSVLLLEGIGDTIRVSLTPPPGGEPVAVVDPYRAMDSLC